jgi:hypothetical protein
VILVEGLFDYAALLQAGFSNVTCSLGTPLHTAEPFAAGVLCLRTEELALIETGKRALCS